MWGRVAGEGGGGGPDPQDPPPPWIRPWGREFNVSVSAVSESRKIKSHVEFKESPLCIFHPLKKTPSPVYFDK